jgi:invasion protein IalB
MHLKTAVTAPHGVPGFGATYCAPRDHGTGLPRQSGLVDNAGISLRIVAWSGVSAGPLPKPARPHVEIGVPLMRKSFPYLSVALLALQGQGAFGHEFVARALNQQPLPRETAIQPAANRWMVAQSNAAPSAAPQPATLPAQRTETTNYENWILTCREFLEGPRKRNCSATVAVQRSETGQTVLALTVQPNEQGRMTASIQTPTGIAIAPGVEVKFEKAAARKLAFDVCEPSRCVASLAADGSLIRDLSTAAKIMIVLQSADGKPVNFEFPIKGFDKAYAGMTKG